MNGVYRAPKSRNVSLPTATCRTVYVLFLLNNIRLWLLARPRAIRLGLRPRPEERVGLERLKGKAAQDRLQYARPLPGRVSVTLVFAALLFILGAVVLQHFHSEQNRIAESDEPHKGRSRGAQELARHFGESRAPATHHRCGRFLRVRLHHSKSMIRVHMCERQYDACMLLYNTGKEDTAAYQEFQLVAVACLALLSFFFFLSHKRSV